MIQNILSITIVFLAAGISIFSVIRSLTSKRSTHCDGCSACDTNNSGRSKSKIFDTIDYKNLVFDNKGK